MKISALRLLNYKGFSDSGFIDLNSSWNVVVGQNNAGKTSLIEGFRLSRNVNKPHKNIDNPKDFPYAPQSCFVVKMQFSREWLKNSWLRRGGVFDLPYKTNDAAGAPVILDPNTFWEGEDLQVELNFTQDNVVSPTWPSHRLFEANGGERFLRIPSTVDRRIGPFTEELGGNLDSLPTIVLQNYASNIYTFEAKRFALGECAHQDTSILDPDARNLPAVLLNLMANPDLFKEFNNNVRAIFPSIKEITVTAKGMNFEIRIWSVDPSTRRDDLAIPLNESGTGVGQVLAILYVAMTNEPGVIAIDEPNSFLHPGAAKKLIQILKHYPQHQYIVSTHSLEVVGAAQPAKLHLVRLSDQKSIVETFDENEIEAKRMMLEEVGASLADVFSAERVIWVEGPTERECFDLIIAQESNGPIVGLSFLALRNTGDLEGRQADAAIDIYNALTQGGSILPVSVWFSFDKDGRSNQEIEDLERRCRGKAKFLPRRMTENYLLNSPAIAVVLGALGEEGITSAKIEELLRKFAPNQMPNGIAANYGTPEFLVNVDGAKLLKDVFNEASDTRLTYRKLRDSIALLKVILENDRESVNELVEFVKSLVC